MVFTVKRNFSEQPSSVVCDAYQSMLESHGYVADAAQWAAMRELQQLYDEICAKQKWHLQLLSRFMKFALPWHGVYLWGGVGRGKSFLMDCFYSVVPNQNKRRVHFHAFMQCLHQQLRDLQGEHDPLRILARQWSEKFHLLCFDEFHVADIADAMIVGRFLELLILHGVVLVMTSNYAPDSLYPKGLQRERFLPTIALIKEHFTIVQVDAGVDYRLQKLEQVEIYHYPGDAGTEEKMRRYFTEIEGAEGWNDDEFKVMGRVLPVRRCGQGVIWFDFMNLCAGPRSQNDYLELARTYHTVLLSDVPVIRSEQANWARRLTWLVDVFYEHKVKLIISAACPVEKIYTEGLQAGEFLRTVSRLIEMRSRAYLAMPHLPDISVAH